ncbi:TetR family transcriptional regulator [Planotetraspora mira]|uniref:TetR family transcriptional regulator n=1 Tax=Planotetraspora mira TaxID=58121 RepID=A0A8J3TSJ7_9ACTN|nr:TetR family transcriptional regulator [Planotetraspora mira]GII31366.1 TetR family transcriptional regulator [Planotetraspora mira]
MSDGLRERKKLQTRRAIFGVALELFRERGFDNVSVAEIAAKAGISKMTVFNYFPTKEDIVLGPMEEHVGDPAAIAEGRAPGEPIVAAFRRTFLERLEGRAPETGLNDDAALLQVLNLISETPSMVVRTFSFRHRSEQMLVEVLRDPAAGPHDLRARLIAGHLTGLWYTLQGENVRRIIGGERVGDVYPDAVAAANLGFDLLADGIGDYGAW